VAIYTLRGDCGSVRVAVRIVGGPKGENDALAGQVRTSLKGIA
jgi:hypothetical protein